MYFLLHFAIFSTAEAPLSLGGPGTIPITLTLMKEVTHNIEGVLSAFSKLLGIKEPINFEKVSETGVKERIGPWAQSPTPTAGEEISDSYGTHPALFLLCPVSCNVCMTMITCRIQSSCYGMKYNHGLRW